MSCRVYIPPGPVCPSRALIAIHGVSRNAEEQIHSWQAFADRLGFMVIAPHFSARHFAGYQRLKAAGPADRADQVLLRLITWLEGTGFRIPRRRVLFGHSGGAQFAHRFLLAHPHVFDAAILSAAGWYTWPTHALRFPAGLRARTRDESHPIALDLHPFLQLPVLVTVGACDQQRDAQLRVDAALDRLQGSNRHERACRWVDALRECANKAGIALQTRIAVLPNAGHPFRENMDAGLDRVADEFLRQIPWLWTHSQ